MASQGPPPAPMSGAVGIIAPQASAIAVAERRRAAEMDKLMQEQAQQAGVLRIVAERNRQLEAQVSGPMRLLQERMQQVFVPQTPVQPPEEAYVAPPVRHPQRVQTNPYAQHHGPVEPGAVQIPAASSSRQPPPSSVAASSGGRPPPPAPGAGGKVAKTRTASPVAMRDTDKRVGGWVEREGGGWKKKKQAPKAPVEVPVEPAPKPITKRKEPEPTVVPATKSKIKPRPALALKDEEPVETFARKYKEKTRTTQGKFEKRRKERVREERIEERLDAIPPTIHEYQQEGRAVKYIKRSAEAARVVTTGVKNLAKRSMQALMGQATSGVSSVTQGIASTAQARLMGAMLQRLRTSRQRAVRGYKMKSPGARDRRAMR